MKKMIFIFCLMASLVLALSSVSAQENPETLLRTADTEIFIKRGFEQNYNETQGCVNEFTGGNVLHQYYIKDGKASDVMTSLQSAPSTVSAANKRLKFDEQRAKGFHVSYRMNRAESIPENAGYCWLRYSDAVLAGAGRESGVILYPGEKAYYFTPVEGVMQYSEIADLSSFGPAGNIKIDVIRLNGIAYFYFNGKFAFQYEDGITNPVSFEGGSMLLEGANRIRCDFDDFTYLPE